jgi:hypothetical protein
VSGGQGHGVWLRHVGVQMYEREVGDPGESWRVSEPRRPHLEEHELAGHSYSNGGGQIPCQLFPHPGEGQLGLDYQPGGREGRRGSWGGDRIHDKNHLSLPLQVSAAGPSPHQLLTSAGSCLLAP